MKTDDKITITVQTTINSNIEKVWKYWTMPEHIIHWYFASDDWHSPRAENDLKVGGKFLTRIEAKDGSFGFDFEGIYETVVPNKLIEYGLADGRKVSIEFIPDDNTTKVIEKFNAETINSIELQQTGWQAILNNLCNFGSIKSLKVIF